MVGKEQIPIDQKVTLDEINSLIRCENNSRVLKRLYFVKFRYLGDSVEEAATKVGVTKKQDITGKRIGIRAAMPP
jgi:putative transposase